MTSDAPAILQQTQDVLQAVIAAYTRLVEDADNDTDRGAWRTSRSVAAMELRTLDPRDPEGQQTLLRRYGELLPLLHAAAPADEALIADVDEAQAVPMSRPSTVTLLPDAAATLRRFTERTGMARDGAVGQAIRLLDFLDLEQRNGTTLILRDGQGREERLRLL